MQNSVYLATETMSALIILILIYANNFEIKQRTLKRKLFNIMLITSEIAVMADAVSYIPYDWNRMPVVFVILMIAVYSLPSITKMAFSSYLYAHISQKKSISAKPFIFMRIFCMAEFVISLLLCVSGKLFYIQDGLFYSGPMEMIYADLTLFSMVAFVVIVFAYGKSLRFHGIMAVLPYCAIPILTMIFAAFTGLNLMVTVLSFSMLLLYVMLQSENESSLFDRANIDELTGLFNRAAYVNEITALSESAKESLVYASVDVNGLKVVNDSLGHTAGDELIQGAAECLKKVFADSGKCFRTGGDEFAVIFFADESKFEMLKEELLSVTKEWKGNYVEALTLSVGYVTKKEFPDEDVIELTKIADKRMYTDKSRFYSSKGVDRRGQNNAYKALSSLYTKILKINITDDSCTVIDMFSDEQTEEKGFSEHISEWLIGFGKSGLVHPDDLKTYLEMTNIDFMREYFKGGKNYLMVTYRRKYDNEFKQAIMEIIPTKEYTNDDQSLYLYVKSIE